MPEVRGRRILLTGATGRMGFPIAVELAKSNEVYAPARFSQPEQKTLLDAAGVRTIAFDLANPDLSPLPRDVDLVFHLGAIVAPQAEDPAIRNKVFDVNAGATGRLMARYRGAEAFVHASTGSVYAYQGARLLREDDPYGLHTGLETYAASKIAGEFMVRQLSTDYGLPAVMLRVFSLYSARGGAISARVDRVARGLPVLLCPEVRNLYTPIYEDDYVEKAIAAAGVAKAPAEVVNFAGTEPVTIEDYCRIAGELLGKTPVFEENPAAYYPICADTTKMVRLLGRCRTPIREGVRRVVEAGQAARIDAL